MLPNFLYEAIYYLLIFIPIYGLYNFLTSTFDFWLVRGVPYRKPKPLFGNFSDLLLFRKSQAEGVNDIYNWFKNERYFGVFRVRTPMLIIRDPELIKHICIKDFHVFCNRGIPVNNTRDPLSGHLFNLEGKQWKNLRGKLTPVFSSSKLKKMFYLLNECLDDLRRLIERKLEYSSVIEVRELIADFTIDVIGSCAFGIQINALSNENSEFRKAAMKLSKPSYSSTLWRMLRTSLPRLYKFLGVQVIDPKVTNFFLHVVNEMVEERECKKILERHDFIDLLIELKNNDLSINEEMVMDKNLMAAQAFVFFVANYETSSNTMAFCLYELAINLEIQEKTRRDVLDSIQKHDNTLTYEAVQNMKYLDMVILETMRKYPSAPLLSRRCETPYEIPDSGGVELPKGMRVIIPIYAIHHDPNYYPEPEKFLPERFNEQNRHNRRSCTYLPFGEGPRNCIGMKFAILQMKIGIITFLKEYRVSICEKTDVPIKFSKRSLVTASENGIWLEISNLKK